MKTLQLKTLRDLSRRAESLVVELWFRSRPKLESLTTCFSCSVRKEESHEGVSSGPLKVFFCKQLEDHCHHLDPVREASGLLGLCAAVDSAYAPEMFAEWVNECHFAFEECKDALFYGHLHQSWVIQQKPAKTWGRGEHGDSPARGSGCVQADKPPYNQTSGTGVELGDMGVSTLGG